MQCCTVRSTVCIVGCLIAQALLFWAAYTLYGTTVASNTTARDLPRRAAINFLVFFSSDLILSKGLETSLWQGDRLPTVGYASLPPLFPFPCHFVLSRHCNISGHIKSCLLSFPAAVSLLRQPRASLDAETATPLYKSPLVAAIQSSPFVVHLDPTLELSCSVACSACI